MNSSFFGLNIGTNALFAAKTALDVTSHNISNMNTEGYSRQIAKQKATIPLPLGTGKGMVGTGSEVYDIVRERDYYLDMKYWNENKMLGEYSIKTTQLSLIEGIFNEPSDEGFNTIFNDFFNMLQDAADNPESSEVRNGLKEQARTFTKFFNDASTRLEEYQKDVNFEIGVRVKDINTIAQKIGSIDREIFRYEQSGDTANDLRDQRDLLVDRLSKIVNVDAKEIEVENSAGKMEKRFMVSMNGQTLVNNFDYSQLEVRVRESKSNPNDVEGLYDIYWDAGLKFDTTDPDLSGELKGYLDMRDGNNNNVFTGEIDSISAANVITFNNFSRTDMQEEGKITINGKEYEYTDFKYDSASDRVQVTLSGTIPPAELSSMTTGTTVQIGKEMDYKGIPHYMDRLNEFVRTFAKSFNTIHEKGYGLDGQKGRDFFAYKDSNGDITNMDPDNYDTLTAKNFMLSTDINDFNNIAAGIEQGLSGDGRNMQNLFGLKTNTQVFNEGTPASYMESIMGELAVNAKQAVTVEQMQTNISKVVENQRLSVSGVDSNEEMTNLVKYNQAYNMAAKMISVMDEIYDVTINRMGVS